MNNLHIVFLLLLNLYCSVVYTQDEVDDCSVNLNKYNINTQPLILAASTRHWYPINYTNYAEILEISTNTSLILICPKGDTLNYFSFFYRVTEVLAKCVGGDKFEVNDEVYSFDKLQCYYPVLPTIQVTNQTCLGPNEYNSTDKYKYWNKILVGYPSNYSFIPVYEVCFDRQQTGPIYALTTITPGLEKSTASVKAQQWVTNKALYNYINVDTEYSCTKQALTFFRILDRNHFNDDDSCCFMKTQLVDQRDVSFAPQRMATYHDVNSIPQCPKENWPVLQESIRKLATKLRRDLNVWTGFYRNFQRPPSMGFLDKDFYIYFRNQFDNAIPVPLFTWKVVYDALTERAVALILVNDPKHKGFLSCEDVCDKLGWLNIQKRRDSKSGYVHCCTLDGFIENFSYYQNEFPHIKGLLQL